MDCHDWNERWSSPERQRSSEPHPLLVAEVAGMTPGTALDLGCGEGRNALWLAEQGWAVTGVDFSDVALSRAAEAAAARGVTPAWVNADLFTYAPPAEAFDLAVLIRVHPLPPARRQVLRAAASSLRPGGTLITIGFDRAQRTPGERGPADPSQLYAIDEIAADLDGLQIVRAESAVTEARTPEGPRRVADVIVRARRPAG